LPEIVVGTREERTEMRRWVVRLLRGKQRTPSPPATGSVSVGIKCVFRTWKIRKCT